MKRERIRRLAAAVACLLAVGMVGGSWAYWSQEIRAVNEYQLGKYSTKLDEVFTAPTDWLPGVGVNKDVWVANEGTVPAFAKVVINQQWIRRETIYDGDGNVVFPAKGDAFPLTFDGASGKEYAAQVQWGKDVVLLNTGAPSMGTLSLGLPKVTSLTDARGKWLLLSEAPDAAGNYTFYYIGALEAGKTTPILVDGVTMNPQIRATILEDHTVWDKTNQKWVTTTVENATYGYENARYTMGVTMYTVQATEAALREMFQANTVTEQAVISYMEIDAVRGKDVDYSRDDTVTEKKLYLNRIDGKLSFTPATGTENWFMSHLNMLPGETYEDTLKIENQTDKAYKIYMQVIPRDQTKLPDELLELIHMKVYNGTTLVYDGTAMGKDYTGSLRNLQNVYEIGKFAAKAQGELRVVLELDKDTPLEYAGILSKIDWKFMVEDDNPSGPKTGDESDAALYIAGMCAAGTALAGCLIYLAATRKRKHERVR